MMDISYSELFDVPVKTEDLEPGMIVRTADQFEGERGSWTCRCVGVIQKVHVHRLGLQDPTHLTNIVYRKLAICDECRINIRKEHSLCSPLSCFMRSGDRRWIVLGKQ